MTCITGGLSVSMAVFIARLSMHMRTPTGLRTITRGLIHGVGPVAFL